MRNFVPVIVGVVVGLLAGFLLGAAVVAGTSTTFATAAVALAVAIGVPVYIQWRQEQAGSTAYDRDIRQRNADRYGLHAVDLNGHIFGPLGSVALSVPLVNLWPSEHDRSGLSASWGGQGARISIEDLPNWELGRSHFLATAAVAAGWKEMSPKVAQYYTARDQYSMLIAQKLGALVRAEYGPEMKFVGPNTDSPPPWCDLSSIAWWTVVRRQKFGRRELSITMTALVGVPHDPVTGARVVRLGSIPVLHARDNVEGDPARLQRVFDALWVEPESKRLALELVRLSDEAEYAVGRFASSCKTYSNRIATARTFEGDCDVCNPWNPR